MQHLKNNFFLFLAFLNAYTSSAQGTGNSPFSVFSPGEIAYENGSIYNLGMGNTGIANRHHHFINFLNPALLANNKGFRIDSLTKIDFSILTQHKTISHHHAKENSGGININYIAIALPLSKVWGTSFGFRPFSTTNYNYSYESRVIGDTTTTILYQKNARGGIYKLFLSNGIGITKYLSVGFECSYLFGNISNKYLANIPSLSTYYNGFNFVKRHTGFEFKPGIRYRIEFFKKIKDSIIYQKFNPNNTGKKITKLSRGLFLNLGITYDYFTPINLTNEISIYTETNNYALIKDSLVSTATEKVSFPQGIRTGFSLEKPMVWSIAADASYYPWSVYKPSNSFMRSDIYTAALGIELTPNGSKSNRAKTYRLGTNYSQLPYSINGAQLADWSVSAGITIPFGKRPAYWFPVLPKLTMALIAGRRGANVEGQIREMYFKLFFSLLISEKWFTISKFN